MAEKQQPAAQPKPVPFPKNWSKMTTAERHKWQEQNRPGYNRAARAAKPPTAPEPAAAPAPAPAHGDDWDDEAEAMRAAGEGDQGDTGETLNVELQLPPAKEGMRSPRETVAELLRDLADMLKPRTE